MDALDQQKRALREAVKKRMPSPGTPEHLASSLAAQDRLSRSDLLQGARVIGLYRALPSECGTSALATALLAAGKELCYPVATPSLRPLSFRRASGLFVRGALGIEEPEGSPVLLADLDVLVVPALAVDPHGHRLGRGRGHYDATLAEASALSIALIFEVQVVQEVPVGEHDRPVSAVCTEARLWRVQG